MDEIFLNHAVNTIKGCMEHCELNFFAYKSTDELSQICLNIISLFAETVTNPVQLLWVSSNEFVNLGDDASLGVLTLHSTLDAMTQSQYRAIIVRGGRENDVSFQWSLLLNAASITADELDAISKENHWLIGYVEIDGCEYKLSVDQFAKFPRINSEDSCCTVMGITDKAAIEPYLDHQSAFLYLLLGAYIV
jgi:hypothetical protein